MSIKSRLDKLEGSSRDESWKTFVSRVVYEREDGNPPGPEDQFMTIAGVPEFFCPSDYESIGAFMDAFDAALVELGGTPFDWENDEIFGPAMERERQKREAPDAALTEASHGN